MDLKRIAVFFLIIGVLALFSIYYPNITSRASYTEYEREPAFVLRVVDGDTLEADIGAIRLLGINTPEKGEPGYEKAKELLMQAENKSIEVLRDKEDTDKYSRLLRYVFYKEDFVNIVILEQGLASAFMTSGLKYEENLLRAEAYARENELGIWKKSAEACADCINLVELNAEEEFFILKNTCSFDCNLDGWYAKDAGRNKFLLEPIEADSEQKITSGKNIWNNDHDAIFIRDTNGLLVFYYPY